MLRFKQFEFSIFGVNTYVVYDEETLDAAVIDPAMESEAEHIRFDLYIHENHLRLQQIINTHLHLDHCFGIDYVKSMYGVPVKAHADDATLGGIMQQQYSLFGLQSKGKNVEIDVPLSDGDIIQIGKGQLQVIHTPGHTAGGICLYYKEGNILISGDTLFHRSIGRTDLMGNHPQLVRSIRERLFTLPDATQVLPGHNQSTSIGEEKRHNPFVKL